MGKKIVITEEDKTNIRQMYSNKPLRNYVFESMISVDGRYIILHDQIWDNQKQIGLGNIWESIDKFKIIFNDIILNDSNYMVIRESILKLPLIENKKTLFELRDIFINEGFFDDTWVGQKLKSTGQGIVDFGKQSWEGIQKMGVAISKGEWSEIVTLLGKGVKFLLRKLKEGMYSTVGMVADAILVATGIGKAVQWIPWALVTSLDVYQLMFNDWPEEQVNESLPLKLLELGFDILGLVFAGVAAKGAKVFFSPLKNLISTPGKAAQWVAKNPKSLSILKQMTEAISKVPTKLKNAQTFLSKRFGKGSEFIGIILGGLGKILNQLKNFLISITGGVGKVGAGVRSGLSTGGLIYGVEKYGENKQNKQWADVQNTIQTNKIKPDFSGLDI